MCLRIGGSASLNAKDMPLLAANRQCSAHIQRITPIAVSSLVDYRTGDVHPMVWI